MRRLFTTLLLALVCACHSSPPVVDAGGDSSSLEAYRAARSRLFDAVYSRRRGHGEPLSADEQRLAARLEALKHEVYAADGGGWPARPFFEVKDDLERTALFAFLSDLPKGGMLHVHSAALGDMRWLIQELSKRDDAYVFRGRSERIPFGALAIFDAPPGDGWLAVAEDRQRAANGDDWAETLYQDLTLGAEDAGRADTWPEFQRKFAMLRALWTDPALTEGYLYEAIASLIRDEQLLYLEMRSGPRPEHIDLIDDLRRKLRAEWPHFDLRLIVNVVRYQNSGESTGEAAERFAELMQGVAEVIRDHPDLVLGFDLVAEEDGGLPTAFFAPTVLELRDRWRREGLRLPLFLHAGESNLVAGTAPRDCEYAADCGAPLNNNLFDAVLLGTRRIGHGLALAKLPGLADEVRRRDIAVEVCPISNQLLGYVPDLRNHPALALLNAGVPITLSPDDPALFQYQGVTHDYWMATVAWNLDLADLKELAMSSLRYAAVDRERKDVMLASWQQQWSRFVARQLRGAAAAEVGGMRR